ncbi:hypothetical protein BZL39_O04190 [Zygosaccharomyces parabailii]|nr:hypothetical protein BZL39_O04190 [Zygosaccharomyces parabailii]
MSDPKTNDLENCFETYEKNEIQLLEDRPAGNLIYFASWYFFQGKWLWNTILPVGCVAAAFLTWVSYFGLREIYYNSKTSEAFPTLWLTIHYFLFFAMFFVDCMEKRKSLILEEKILQKLLGAVSETDLMGDPAAWRRIAFNVNQCFIGKQYNSFIFYGGEQCRCFFVKEVLVPIDSGSYAIRTCYNDNIYTDFCKNSFNKKLAQKAVANYNKSVENCGELSQMNGVDCDNGLFEKFHIISMNSVLYLFSIEIAFSAIMSLAIVGVLLYRAIFN